MENETGYQDVLTAIGDLGKSVDSKIDSIKADQNELSAKLVKLETKPNDSITKEEVEKITESIVGKAHPSASKAVVPNTVIDIEDKIERFRNSSKNIPEQKWTSAYGSKFKNMGNFLFAVKNKSPILMDYKTTLIEGTDSLGGYLVPTEFSNVIIKLLRDESLIMRIANVIPMSSWKRQIPKQLTNVSVAWVAEAGEKTETNPTFGQVEQVAKVLAAIIKCTDEILRDSAINLTAFLSELVAEAMALEIERVALVGRVASGDPFNGIVYASGTNVTTMTGSTVVFDDISNLLFSLSASYAQGGKLILSRLGLKKLIQLKDNQGNAIWSPPAGNVPATIWNIPYEISSQIPATFGPGGDETCAIFGRFDKYLLVSPREGLAVKVSQDAYDGSTSAFLNDETWLRFAQALSIDVSVPSAFGYLFFK